jgi:hypothetical protein
LFSPTLSRSRGNPEALFFSDNQIWSCRKQDSGKYPLMHLVENRPRQIIYTNTKQTFIFFCRVFLDTIIFPSGPPASHQDRQGFRGQAAPRLRRQPPRQVAAVNRNLFLSLPTGGREEEVNRLFKVLTTRSYIIILLHHDARTGRTKEEEANIIFYVRAARMIHTYFSSVVGARRPSPV